MPRFYMHIRQGDRLFEDPEGEEFASLVEARAEAVMSARELMAEMVAAGKSPRNNRFEIADDSGHVV
jgi:hypothetical protein